MLQFKFPCIRVTKFPQLGEHLNQLVMFDFTRNVSPISLHRDWSMAPVTSSDVGVVVEYGKVESFTDQFGLGHTMLCTLLKS